MFKKALLLFLCFFAFQLSATTLPLKTGRWIFDRYRNVTIDDFDYSYTIDSIDYANGRITLNDGSLWTVGDMEDETRSFYQQKNPQALSETSLYLLSQWQSGDILIFHKVVNRESLLAYNASTDMLLDFFPTGAPTNPVLRIASITNTNDTEYHYTYNSKTQSLQQYQTNNWRVVIVLTDGSRWEGKPGRPLLSWMEGDPIHVSKDTPWWSSNTHILMNCKTTNKGLFIPVASLCRVGVKQQLW
ncbi:MAG: hypothetical protein JSR37_03465 [Verrucomicrobia bacterium]|nr:hypothetical protein [Verrucomicrobiota bacterium]MBS0636899.1 hypothetical protein [Verrucomicrobiota bacterium]